MRHGKVHLKHSYVVEDFNNENLFFSTNNLQGFFFVLFFFYLYQIDFEVTYDKRFKKPLKPAEDQEPRNLKKDPK